MLRWILRQTQERPQGGPFDGSFDKLRRGLRGDLRAGSCDPSTSPPRLSSGHASINSGGASGHGAGILSIIRGGCGRSPDRATVARSGDRPQQAIPRRIEKIRLGGDPAEGGADRGHTTRSWLSTINHVSMTWAIVAFAGRRVVYARDFALLGADPQHVLGSR